MAKISIICRGGVAGMLHALIILCQRIVWPSTYDVRMDQRVRKIGPCGRSACSDTHTRMQMHDPECKCTIGSWFAQFDWRSHYCDWPKFPRITKTDAIIETIPVPSIMSFGAVIVNNAFPWSHYSAQGLNCPIFLGTEQIMAA